MNRKSHIEPINESVRRSRSEASHLTHNLLDKTYDPFKVQVEPPSSIRNSELIEMHNLAHLTMVPPNINTSKAMEESSAFTGDIIEHIDTHRVINPYPSNTKNDLLPLSPTKSKVSISHSKRTKSTQAGTIYRNANYPYFNLTLTFYNMRAPMKILLPIYLASLIVRCYTVLYLIFVLWLGIKDKKFDRW